MDRQNKNVLVSVPPAPLDPRPSQAVISSRCDCEIGWCNGDDCPEELCWLGETTTDSRCPRRVQEIHELPVICDHIVAEGELCGECWKVDKKEVMENPTYEICEHHVLLHEKCYLCKGETPPTAVEHCDGKHPVQGIKYEGPLEILVCLDRKCAHITAKCTHQVGIPAEEDSVPRKYVTSACKWNEDGTVLRCTYCGKDCS